MIYLFMNDLLDVGENLTLYLPCTPVLWSNL